MHGQFLQIGLIAVDTCQMGQVQHWTLLLGSNALWTSMGQHQTLRSDSSALWTLTWRKSQRLIIFEYQSVNCFH